MKVKFLMNWKEYVMAFLKDPLLLSKWQSEYSYDNREGRVTSRVNSGYKSVVNRDNDTGSVFMFIEDIHLKIMPYRFNRGSYHATLAEDDPELATIISRAIGDNQYVDDLSEAVEDFIRSAAHTIFTFSEAYYELLHETNNEGTMTNISVRYIYPSSMKNIFGWYFQIIPWSVAKQSRIKAGIKKVPREKLLHIKPPKDLGGKRGVKTLLKQLIALNHVTPDFQIKILEQNRNIGFDLDFYHTEKYLAKATATKKFGWNQRDFRDNNILEYYSIHRILTEATALAIIRRHILGTLNSALKSNLKIDNQILIHNLPTEKTIATEKIRLLKGGLEFSSILQRIKTLE